MFKKSADGIAKKGKTEGKNLGDSGPKVLGMEGKPNKMGGKDQMDMKKMGRGLAKVKNQMMRKAGRGR
jgi:hypothetical protein